MRTTRKFTVSTNDCLCGCRKKLLAVHLSGFANASPTGSFLASNGVRLDHSEGRTLLVWDAHSSTLYVPHAVPPGIAVTVRTLKAILKAIAECEAADVAAAAAEDAALNQATSDISVLQLIDLIAPEHQRTSCSDTNLNNGLCSDRSFRCTRCLLLDLATNPDTRDYVAPEGYFLTQEA